jgi:hypothetical protein
VFGSLERRRARAFFVFLVANLLASLTFTVESQNSKRFFGVFFVAHLRCGSTNAFDVEKEQQEPPQH